MKQRKQIRTERGSLRFLAVSLVIAHPDYPESLSKAVSEARATLKRSGMQCSRASIFRWHVNFAKRGKDSLEFPPRTRCRKAVSAELLEFLKKSKENDPDVTIPEILRMAKLHSDNKMSSGLPHRTTLYRTARDLDLPLPKRRKMQWTQRPFEYPHRMQMVLCDGKHFRAGGSRLKRVVFSFIDDCTRRVLGVIVGSSENSPLFLQGLYTLITKFGLPRTIYLDKGSAFTSAVAEEVARSLDITFIFGATRYPEGHGKIERFNATLEAQCLRGLSKPSIDPDCASLTLRIQHYIDHLYNINKHSSTGRSPTEHFDADTVKPLDYPESLSKLRECFVVKIERKVRRDNAVEYGDEIYELPYGFRDKWVTLYYNAITEKLLFPVGSELIELHQTDLASNARQRKSKRQIGKEIENREITTASEICFEKHHRPIVNPDGGFSQTYEESF